MIKDTITEIEQKLSGHCIFKATHPNCFVNEEILKKKMEQGLPAWAKEQIQTDLSTFATIKETDLDQYHADPRFNMLVRFQIKNGQVLGFYRENINTLPAYKIMKDVLQYLAERQFIPDTDILIGLSDYFHSTLKPPMPVFVFAKDASDDYEKDLILLPDWMNLVNFSKNVPAMREGSRKYPWDMKKTILFWRGSEAGDSLHFRQKLVALSKQYPEMIDAQYSNAKNFVQPIDHLNYKYLISVDGVRATWTRLVWHLYSNSLTFKHQSNQMQWYYNAVKPQVHYVPVEDETSLLQAIDWAEKHPQDVQLIIKQSTDFVENNLMLEDMYHYIAVVLQEYTKKLEKK